MSFKPQCCLASKDWSRQSLVCRKNPFCGSSLQFGQLGDNIQTLPIVSTYRNKKYSKDFSMYFLVLPKRQRHLLVSSFFTSQCNLLSEGNMSIIEISPSWSRYMNLFPVLLSYMLPCTDYQQLCHSSHMLTSVFWWYSTHCSNPEVRIRKKMQPKFEAAVRTSMKRASEQAPTWHSWPLAYRSLWCESFQLSKGPSIKYVHPKLAILTPPSTHYDVIVTM